MGINMHLKKSDLKIEKIYNDYGKLIFTIAYNELHDYQLAEDVTQETVVKLIKYPHVVNRLEGNELKNYIAKIALNIGYNYYNRRCKDKPTELRDPDSFSEEDKAQPSCGLEELVIGRSSIDIMKKELEKMDFKYRAPLVLHKLYGHTVAEVSQLLDVPERTVKYRISNAVGLLKEALRKGECDNERKECI